MILAAMNTLIEVDSFSQDLYLTEKELYKSHIRQITETAKRDKVPEVIKFLKELEETVQAHINLLKDDIYKLQQLTELLEGEYQELEQILLNLTDEWKNPSISYGLGEVVLTKSQAYDHLSKMPIYHLLVFKSDNNTKYKFTNCFIGFSDKDITPYTNFDIWINVKITELTRCIDIKTLTNKFSSIKEYLTRIYGVKEVYDLLEDIHLYGLPNSSMVLKSFREEFNNQKNKIYLQEAGFHEFTDDLLTLVRDLRRYINIKDESMKEIFGDEYNNELEKAEKSLNLQIEKVIISKKQLIKLENVITSGEIQTKD